MTDKLIQAYFTKCSYLSAHYSYNQFFNVPHDLFIMPVQYNILKQVGWIAFFESNNIPIHKRESVFTPIHTIYYMQTTGWKIFIIPWIILQTNFDYEQIERSLDNVFNDHKVPLYMKKTLAYAINSDYLLHHSNKEYHQNISINVSTRALDNIYNQFSKLQLKEYRQFLFRKGLQYAWESNGYLRYFNEFNMEFIFCKSILRLIKNDAVQLLNRKYKSYYLHEYYKFLIKLNNLPGKFTQANLQKIEQFALSLRLKHNYIKDQVKLLELIISIFNNYAYSSELISAILAKKYLNYLKIV